SRNQIEQIRLLMSTFQDGTGQLRIKDGGTLPNWRDFERSVAVTFKGFAFENKGFLDVMIAGKEVKEKGEIGISCKMRNTLSSFISNETISMELSNALNKFWSELQKNKIHNIGHVRLVPEKAGKIIVDLYESWKYEAVKNDKINIAKSFYLTCLYDEKNGLYQLFALPFLLPNPKSLKWQIRESKDGDENRGTLIAKKKDKVIIEWYGTSGGQLKYYPTKNDVIWQSNVFKLEAIPKNKIGDVLIQKAKTYFPEKWRF
ncbi:MAG TPA: hypothetical protein VG676_16685, partial [Chitinophagaceae bacterium]|nr:hypothetical protein [Chitinophagaceae bacterium]